MPLGDFEVTAAMLEAAFGWVAAGLTGVSAGAVGAVGGAAVLGGYSLWAAENPEEAAEFEQYLAENVVSQDVGGNQQLAMNLQAMPDSLKDSIISYTSSCVSNYKPLPIVPTDFGYPYVVAGCPTSGTIGGYYMSTPSSRYLSHINSNDRIIASYQIYSGRATLTDVFIFDSDVTVYGTETQLGVMSDQSFSYRIYRGASNGSTTSVSVTTQSDGVYKRALTTITSGSSSFYYVGIKGLSLGAGFEPVPSMSGVNSGLSTAFDSLVAGTGTAADVAVAGGVQAVILPNVAINEGTVTVDDSYDLSGVTYPDITITIDGGGGIVPVPTDVLTALQQIIGLLTPMGIVSGIPPIIQDIDDKMGAIVDEWPGVMDILDGLGLLPPIVQDIADGMGVIIDIPQSLEDITDILLPIPQSLQGLLDGVTIDIPQTLAQILNGTFSIPTAIDGVITGVAALPAAIAGALDIDWVLENTEELKDRLPDLDAPLILPQASFDDLKNVANDYKERTPLGKIFEAYEGTFDVMSTSPQGAPRYEITFPSPINFSFVIDFSVFDGLFVQLAHAFFYLLAIFWYLKFLKSVKGWVDSWMTFDGKFFHVAGEEAGASWE